MRFRDFNFALAIIISVIAHALLWPASERIMLPGYAGAVRGAPTEISLQLSDDSKGERPKPPTPAAIPKPPQVNPPDDMGEARGKGTGAQAAKGDQPLLAPQADQDQAFLSRDPVGQGHVGEVPTAYTGPRGQDGHGGQRGGPQTPEAARESSPAASSAAQLPPSPATPSPVEAMSQLPSPKPSPETDAPEVKPTNVPPRESVVKAPEPETPSKTPKDVTPLASKTESIGASAPDLNKPVAEAVKPTAPLANLPKEDGQALATASDTGPIAVAKPAVGTAPPTPGAPPEHPSVVKAEQYALLPAPVSAPPMPEVKPPQPKPLLLDAAQTPTPPPDLPAKASPPTPPTAALVATGDALAPGRDHTSADPAQESDSESDAFRKNSTVVSLRDGKLDVRFGRKVKTTRPHFLPGAEAAFYANPDPYLVLKVSIDRTGNVAHIPEVIRSTGSVLLDQPIRVAVMDWWFEPTHDDQGRPVDDVLLLPFRIR